MTDEGEGMAGTVEQTAWEAYEDLVESILQNADPADGWDSGSDVEALLYVRHLEAENERLREAQRLRETLRRIAAEDYRGNKPSTVVIAQQAISGGSGGGE